MNERIDPFLYGCSQDKGLGKFVEERFENGGRRITPEAVNVLLGLGQGHPYRTQQLTFHAFRLSG